MEFATYLMWAGEFLGLSATVSLWAIPVIIVAFMAALTTTIYYYQEIYADLKAAYDSLFKTKEINTEPQKDLKIDARGVAKEDRVLSNYTEIGSKPLGLDKGAIYELNREKGKKIFVKESNKITQSFFGDRIAGEFDSTKFIAELIASNLHRLYLGDLTPVNYGIKDDQTRYIASKEIPGFRNLFEHIGITEQQHKDKAGIAAYQGEALAPIVTKSNRQTIVNLEAAIAACVMNANLDYSNPANLGAVGRKGIFKKQYAASLDYGCALTYKSEGSIIELNMGIQLALGSFEPSLFLSNKFAAALEKAAATNDQHIKYMLEATINNLIADKICTKEELDKFAKERLINVNNADNLIDDLFNHIKQTQIDARNYAYAIRIKIAADAKDVKALAELLHNIPENLNLNTPILWINTNEEYIKLQKDHPFNFMQVLYTKQIRSITDYIEEFIRTNPNLPQLELLRRNLWDDQHVSVAVESLNQEDKGLEGVLSEISRLLKEYKPTGKNFIDKNILAGNIIKSMQPFFKNALNRDSSQKYNIQQICVDFISSYNKFDKEKLLENYNSIFASKINYLVSINGENVTLENVKLNMSQDLPNLPWVCAQR